MVVCAACDQLVALLHQRSPQGSGICPHLQATQTFQLLSLAVKHGMALCSKDMLYAVEQSLNPLCT